MKPRQPTTGAADGEFIWRTAERGALWKQAVVFWPPYDDYQKKAADREIPVVVLDPVS